MICRAVFYTKNILKNQEFRLFLDLIKDGIPSQTTPDLYIIMLNPGSCGTGKKEYNKVIEVNPDPTLHRIKALFHEFSDIHHIRVLNLSDLVNPDAKDFYSILPRIEKKIGKEHSLFDSSRKEALDKLVAPGPKVYFACGVNPRNTELISQAKNALEAKGGIILNSLSKYYHPLTRPSKNSLPEGWKAQAVKDLMQHLG